VQAGDVGTTSRSVVVGVDAPEAPCPAVVFAAEEARARDLPLCLVHVVPWPNPGAAATRYADRLWVQELRHGAETLLGEAAAVVGHLLPPGRTTTRVEFGDPVAELVRAASAAALLVVGARGIGGLTGLVIGSTAFAVAAYATCPVVVLPVQPAVVDVDQRSVVVGVGGCGRDDDALAFAFAEAGLRNAELVAVHAWQDALAGDPASEARDRGRLLSEALAGHREAAPDVVVREIAVRERAGAALVDASRTAELLVVGRSHRRAVGRVASPTHGALHRAGCPVAVVPGAAAGPRPAGA
jgi:nucleotide-binding universal stress UspA family protein